jgi:hypothetical protein
VSEIERRVMSLVGQKRTCAVQEPMSALGHKRTRRDCLELALRHRVGVQGSDISALASRNKTESRMSKTQTYILTAVAAAGIALGGIFGASAVPISGNLVGAAPELQKVYYYHRHARRYYRRAYRRGYYGGYYGGYYPGYYGGYYRGYPGYYGGYYRRW